MSRRRQEYKDCDSDSDICEFCSHTREEHVDHFGRCTLCGCRKFWIDAEEMRAYDDESDESD